MRVSAVVIMMSLAALSAAQESAEGRMEETLSLVRGFMEHEREVMIEEELRLTDQEADGFWPIYNRYRGEIQALLDRYTEEVIAPFAENRGSLSDDLAQQIVDGYFAMEKDILAVRETYVSEFTQVISLQKAARFYQMENRIDTVADLSVMREFPLIDVPGEVQRGR